MYRKGDINDKTAKSFIYSINQDTKEFDELAELIKQKTGEVIKKRNSIDYEALRKEGTQKFFNALYNQNEFQKLIDEIIKLNNNNEITIESTMRDNHDFYYKHNDLYLTVLAIYNYTIKYCSKKQHALLVVEYLTQ